jgi:hypothetical protein
MRTFRVKVMATPAKKARASALLVLGGDTWAWCIDRFHAQIRDGLPNANSVVQMWPDQKRHGPFGELTAHCAQDVIKAWSAAFFETVKRRKKGKQARLPLRKRWWVPVTWRKGEFALSAASEDRRAPSEIARAEHRRVGSPARRDRRRHLFDADRGLARTRAAAPSVRGAAPLAAPKAA